MLRPRLVALTLAAGVTLTACTGGGDGPATAPTSSPTADPAPAPLPTAGPVPGPEPRACYRLDLEAALAPTAEGSPVDCGGRHTARTVAVGTLDNRLEGHLLAVDSRQVRDAVAEACPARFEEFVGGSEDDRRLSMLRPVWFTPTLEESAAGAQWFRCDAVAVAGTDRLADLSGRLEGALDRPADRDRYAMCGTAAPDADDFERVVCSARHTWRAVGVVDFEPGDYPGARAARERGQGQCEDAGVRVAGDPLDFEWAYEWPTAEQWRDGQTYGRCWAPV